MKQQELSTKQSPAKLHNPLPAAGTRMRHFGVALLNSRFLVPALFVVALLLRLFRLDAQSLWLDEGSTWQTIQQPWGVLLRELFSPDAAYPLYHLLLKAWVAPAGDSAWALRFPSALAGAGAVVALYVAGRELFRPPPEHAGQPRGDPRPLVAALLLLVAPFALWYAQEAKTYSLLLLVATLLLWSLLRALRRDRADAQQRVPTDEHAARRGSRRDWGLLAALALTSIFVHRLALLLLPAVWAGILLTRRRENTSADQAGEKIAAGRQRLVRAGPWLLLSAAGVGVIAAMVQGLGNEQAATGAYIPAAPLEAIRLTFVRFSVNRWPGEVPGWWLLPWIVLTLWGGAALLRDLLRRRQTVDPTPRIVLLCFLLIPPGLFLAQLAFTRLYEARYLILIFPAWLLLLVYPLSGQAADAQTDLRVGRQADAGKRVLTQHVFVRRRLLPWIAGMLVAAVPAVNVAVLLQPEQGLFSGDPVKEQYRAALQELALRVHPDDLVIIHPFYLRPLYDYYMQRFTEDSPPEPVAFDTFKQGQVEFSRKDWDTQRRERFAGHVRSFLLIAPEHARTVDRPPAEGDAYGLVGLYFRYSFEQQKWPCGIWRFNGAHLFCQDSPEAYETGEVPQPATRRSARFGEEIELLGYTLKATTPAGAGVYRAGGTLPITLFWDVTRPPAEDYAMFLHLCRDCEVPPAAGTDGPPLEGYLPTSTWLPGNPVHDERAIPLPDDLPPGRYTLLLGVTRPGDPSPTARLPVNSAEGTAEGAEVLDNNRLRLGTVEIVAPE
jgi:mannosyltransferase